MQTKHQVQQLLALAGVSPNKRLGQNFLIDLNLMRLLIDIADIKTDDIILEVGCGTGSLTEGLAEKAGKIIVAEFDEKLAKIAQGLLAPKKNTEIIHTDILETKHTIAPQIMDRIKSARRELIGKFMLVANLPYSVACPVVLNLVTGPVKADAMYITVQKEVAQRMTAKPGDGHYGIISITLAATGDVKIERILKPSVFWPAPQVSSAMVSYVRDETKAGQIKDIDLFIEVVNLFLNHRRKMLKACTKLASPNLSRIEDWSEIFETASIDPTARPEQIRPEDYVTLANACYRKLTSRQ